MRQGYPALPQPTPSFKVLPRMGEEFSEHEAESLTFEVAREDAASRLDSYLAARIEDWSRARISRLIENGDVLVGGLTSKPSCRLRPNDIVEVELVTGSPLTSVSPEYIPLDIVHEDDDLLVVNKPAGLVVHPGAGVSNGTLANGLAFHFQDMPTSGGGLRPGIVHRLDKNTSGLVVVAKTDYAHEKLAEQFQRREVFKSYIALVHGLVSEDKGRIEEPISRDPSRRIRMAVVRGGRTALSLYKVRRRFDRFTLLDVEIKTGRTHQIRVHMAWIKHPVVGDDLYGNGRDKNIANPALRAAISSMNRHFLHAERLDFRQPRTNELLQFRAPLPSELLAVLTLMEHVNG